MVVTLGQQYNTGEDPTVMLYTYYINAGTPDKNKTLFLLTFSVLFVVFVANSKKLLDTVANLARGLNMVDREF